MPSTVLVRVSGRDRPGITAGLMEVMAHDDVEIVDIEQTVVRGRLELSVLIDVPAGNAALKDLLFYGWENGVQVDFEVVEGDVSPVAGGQWVVTIIAVHVTPAVFGAVAGAIAGSGGNIDRIVRIADYPVQSYELAVSGGDLAAMRRDLGEAASWHGFDVAVQAEGLNRRAKRLVVLDVDSTLIQDEVIDMLAAEAGVGAETSRITARAMAGELDFEQALRARVALLAGTPMEVIELVASRIRLTPGARTFVRTLKRLGMKVAIVSGGFTVFTDRLRAQLSLDHATANVLAVADGVVTGEVVGPIIDRPGKAAAVKAIAEAEGVPLGQVVAIGDGANDLDMLAIAGLGIAFNAKPIVRQAADTAVTVPYLDAILFLFGIRRGDVEAADAADGL
jgi:phosphoserine phosphatase